VGGATASSNTYISNAAIGHIRKSCVTTYYVSAAGGVVGGGTASSNAYIHNQRRDRSYPQELWSPLTM